MVRQQLNDLVTSDFDKEAAAKMVAFFIAILFVEHNSSATRGLTKPALIWCYSIDLLTRF
jgi:hypothetical protein